MNSIEWTLKLVDKELGKRNIQWALVGGLAVSARCEPRTTRDVEIVVAVENDEQAELLINELCRSRCAPKWCQA